MTKQITDEMRDKLTKIKPKVWASIVPGRTTKSVVALHTSLGHAKNAALNSSPVLPPGARGAFTRIPYDKDKGGHPVGESEIYELVDGEWTLRYSVSNLTYPNELPWRM